MDYDLNILFKGKVAADIESTDKILTTELIFSGLLKELTNEECVALFSVLLFQIKSSKADECQSRISETF